MSREVEVWADWAELGGAVRMGRLRAVEARGKEIFSFEYDRPWLERGGSIRLDPDLGLVDGPQYLDGETRPNFGLFLDSSPDRWGRVLMQRREAAMARKEGRREHRLRELDFLLGVHDEQRMGALRFRDPEQGGRWLNDDPAMATPPWTSLRELEQASWKLQRDDAGNDAETLKWLNLLLAPGSSLGGARPKAGVKDEHNDLWIAKFPGRADSRDVGAWEMVVHELAARSGVRVAEARLEAYARKRRTFLTKRFDRRVVSGERRRVHFASAMTLLGQNDGAGSGSGVSYLELAEWILRNGAAPNEDLAQLWSRIVFSIAAGNTDDHLRNHGFLLTEDGWRLAPAYDLNPDPDGTGLSLNISETENALDFDLAREVAVYFRVSGKDAKRIVEMTAKGVGGWRELASAHRIPKVEQDEMAAAFRRVD